MGTSELSETTVDVVVVGAGAAGLAAAITAARLGVSVVVLEKQPEESAGGNTVVSGGVLFHHDDPAAAATYLRSLNGPAPIRDDVVETWARETALNREWLSELGATVTKLDMHPDPEFPELAGSECYQGYWAVDGIFGEGNLHRFLLRRALDAGVDIRFDTPIAALLRVEGEVTGARAASGKEVHARGGVILATGGFAGSADAVATHLGIPAASPWGSPHCTGDGLAMALDVGADTTHLDSHMRLLGTAVPGYRAGVAIHVQPGCGFVFVDDAGHRFVDESLRNCHGHVRGADGFERFAQGPFWLIVDDAALSHGPLAAPAPFGWANRIEGHGWSEDNRAEDEMGLMHRASTIAELALAIGVDLAVLEATMANYNAAAESSIDGFGRPASTVVPLQRAPFAALRCTPLVGFTGGGPVRDGGSRVLDRSGEPIVGLYSAGEVSTPYGHCRDGGMMIGDALASGRVAGRSAASRRVSSPSS